MILLSEDAFRYVFIWPDSNTAQLESGICGSFRVSSEKICAQKSFWFQETGDVFVDIKVEIAVCGEVLELDNLKLDIEEADKYFAIADS